VPPRARRVLLQTRLLLSARTEFEFEQQTPQARLCARLALAGVALLP